LVDPDPWKDWGAIDYLRHYLEEAVKDLNWLDNYDAPMVQAARSHIRDALTALDRMETEPQPDLGEQMRQAQRNERQQRANADRWHEAATYPRILLERLASGEFDAEAWKPYASEALRLILVAEAAQPIGPVRVIPPKDTRQSEGRRR